MCGWYYHKATCFYWDWLLKSCFILQKKLKKGLYATIAETGMACASSLFQFPSLFNVFSKYLLLQNLILQITRPVIFPEEFIPHQGLSSGTCRRITQSYSKSLCCYLLR